jgi:hypothetical protein
MKYENRMSFDQACKHYRKVFGRTAGEPTEERSTLKAGVWRLADAQGQGLAWLYYDGSIMSGQVQAMFAQRV